MTTFYIKHSFSCLPDCKFDVEVDKNTRVVVVESTHFDSDLFGSLVADLLPEKLGVVAYRDDDAGWTPPPARYRVLVKFAGVDLEASVVKLASALGRHRVAVRLDPVEP
jgi:hypothetical protein